MKKDTQKIVLGCGSALLLFLGFGIYYFRFLPAPPKFPLHSCVEDIRTHRVLEVTYLAPRFGIDPTLRTGKILKLGQATDEDLKAGDSVNLGPDSSLSAVPCK
jgi:hypothetical protein